MSGLCSSWLFWFVMLTSITMSVLSSFFFGWFLGVSSGRRRESVRWEARVRALHAKWDREHTDSDNPSQTASKSARIQEERNTGERRTQ